MSEFIKFKEAVQEQFNKMKGANEVLFRTAVSKEDLWETYLESFPPGTNEIYKERRHYDCNCCKSFIRAAGNMVAIIDNELVSLWDIEVPYPFDVVSKALSDLVKSNTVRDIFMSAEAKLGTDKNRQLLEDNSVKVWDHFYLELPRNYVAVSDSVGAVIGPYRDSKNVFERSMEELTLDAGETILELIDQGSLYRGEEHRKNVVSFIKSKTAYDSFTGDKDLWLWKNSINNPTSRVRNSALGTLLIDLSNDVELDEAVRKFERVMAPENYKRPNEIFTKRMVEEAEQTITEMGLLDSLPRKFAMLDDITVNNVLFVNRDAKKKMGLNVFDDLKESIPANPKNFGKVEEVSVDDFVENILPHADSIELMMENKHRNNLMSLVAPVNPEAKTMFKWDNNFSWAYNGDVTDSLMKENVKNAGGRVEGDLRFSIQWNEENDNQNDFDAHCVEPRGGKHIYYGDKRSSSSGTLDVDIINPGRAVAVENIIYTDKNKMPEGIYHFYVNNYTNRRGQSGFRAEIEFDGEVYSFNYPKPMNGGSNVTVAKVKFSRANGFEIVESMDSTVTSQEIWDVKTNNFTKVSSIMFSPNYWDEQTGNGNKHYFFFLDGCKNEGLPRGFYNEFLKEDLLKQKRVFAALGSKMRVAESDDQLSGLGFSSTNRNEVIAKVEGKFTRVIKIKF